MNKLNTLDKRKSLTLANAFQEFLVSQAAKGIKEKTLKTYRSHYAAAAKHLDMSLSFSQLTQPNFLRRGQSLLNKRLPHHLWLLDFEDHSPRYQNEMLFLLL